jgi:hypothetical protein
MKNIVASLALCAVILHQAAPVAAQEPTQASMPPVVKGTYVEVERGLLIDSRLTRGLTGPYVVEIQRPGRDKSELIRLPAGVQPQSARSQKPALSSSAVGASSAPDARDDSLRALLAGTADCIPGAPVR